MNGIVLATGDLAPDREDPDSCFAATAATLNQAELVFGQLETSFASRGTRLPQARHAVMAQPACAPALARAGFDVLSLSPATTASTGATKPSSRRSRISRRPASRWWVPARTSPPRAAR